jgi:hypothetical protein
VLVVTCVGAQVTEISLSVPTLPPTSATPTSLPTMTMTTVLAGLNAPCRFDGDCQRNLVCSSALVCRAGA